MKTQQIIAIHGGDCFNTNKEYLEFLKSFPLDLDSLRPKERWNNKLAKSLGTDYDVLRPKMPNAFNAQYEEWKIWFEKVIPLVSNNIILIGHSLGGIFLAKYLAENKVNKKIKAVVLIAPPAKDTSEPIATFKLPKSLKNLSKQVKKIFLLHSEDDEVVPISHLKVYERLLPSATTMIFKNRGHFNQESFPEIIKLIKSL